MTNEDKQKAQQVIASFEASGCGVWRRRTANRLRRTLEKRPGEFWDSYFEVMSPPSVEAIVWMKTGKITDQTTFGELDGIMRALYAAPEGQGSANLLQECDAE